MPGTALVLGIRAVPGGFYPFFDIPSAWRALKRFAASTPSAGKFRGSALFFFISFHCFFGGNEVYWRFHCSSKWKTTAHCTQPVRYLQKKVLD